MSKIKIEGSTLNNNGLLNFGEINGSTVHGQVVAEKIADSFNSLQESQANNEVKALLAQLLAEIQRLNEQQPELEILEDMSRDAEVLIHESDRETPRKRWYEASLDGLKATALTVGEAAKPILDIATKLSPLLLGV